MGESSGGQINFFVIIGDGTLKTRVGDHKMAKHDDVMHIICERSLIKEHLAVKWRQ